MDTAKKVLHNTVAVMAGNAIAGLLGMLCTIYMARYLGVDRFGVLSFVLTYIGFFAIITEVAANQIIVREIARDPAGAPRLIGNALMMRLALSLVAIIASCVIITFFRRSADTRILVYIASISFPLSVGGIYISIFRSRLKMVYAAGVDVLTNLLKLALIIFFMRIEASLTWFVIGLVLVVVPGILVNLLTSRRFVRPEFTFDPGLWKRFWLESWPIVLTAVFVTVYLRIDQMMLYQMRGAEEVGYYAAAVKLVDVFGIIPSAFVMSVFPVFSSYHAEHSDRLRKAYQVSFKCMATLIVPIAFGIFAIAGSVIEIVYGAQFLASANVLRILIWSEVFVFVGMVHSNLLVSTGLQKLDLSFAILSASINVAMNLILIPHHGMTGAAISTLVSYGIWIPASYIIQKTRPYATAMSRALVKPLIASLGMGCFVYAARGLHMPLAVVVFSGFAAYCVLLFLIKGVLISDIEYVKNIVMLKR